MLQQTLAAFAFSSFQDTFMHKIKSSDEKDLQRKLLMFQLVCDTNDGDCEAQLSSMFWVPQRIHDLRTVHDLLCNSLLPRS